MPYVLTNDFSTRYAEQVDNMYILVHMHTYISYIGNQ